MGERGVGEGLRLADLLAALSLATDLAHQVPAESALKDALLAVAFARHLGLAGSDLSDVYYLALLYHLGCTGAAEEQGRVSGGDDGSVRRGFSEPDFTDNIQILRLAMTELANSLPATDRIKAVATFMTAGKDFMLGAHNAICETSARLAERPGAGRNVSKALLEVFARWDVAGGARHPKPRRVSSRWEASDVNCRIEGHVEVISGIKPFGELADPPGVAKCEGRLGRWRTRSSRAQPCRMAMRSGRNRSHGVLTEFRWISESAARPSVVEPGAQI